MNKLVQEIARRLEGINEADLSTAESQIVQLLIDAGYVELDEHKDVRVIKSR